MTDRDEGRACGGADAVGLGVPAEANTQANEDQELLEAVRRVAETVLGPNAQDTDRGTGPNLENFRALAEAGVFGMALPRAYGGRDVAGSVQREITETLASYCGVTTFTQAQHHGPSRMIANSPNEELKRHLLPDLAAGRRFCAVSFAHLRRPGPPVLSAEPVSGGYRLTGTAPWVTGWGLMNQVVFGATLPDGRFLYVWSPGRHEDFPELFADATPSDGDWGTLTASAPLPLCAMNASATCELTLNGWFIPQAHLLNESGRETMRRNDRNGVLGATVMPLGCGKASVRLLCETAEKRGLPAVHRAAASFQAEWNALRQSLRDYDGRTGEPDFFENAVRLRAWCIEFGVRAAHAAVAACSGSANNLHHPAQRLYREAMFYTIQAQTQEVMDTTLSRLERTTPESS